MCLVEGFLVVAMTLGDVSCTFKKPVYVLFI